MLGHSVWFCGLLFIAPPRRDILLSLFRVGGGKERRVAPVLYGTG